MSTDLDLDARLRTAGASLRHAVDVIPADAPPPAPAVPSRRPLLAAAAILLVVAAIAGAVALRSGAGDSDSEGSVTSDPGGLPRWVVDEPPGDMVPSAFDELPYPGPPEPLPPTWFAVFGRTADTGEVAVMITPDDQPWNPGGRQVDVRGHEAFVSRDDLDGIRVEWMEAAGVRVAVNSRTLAEAQVLDVANALRVEGRTARLVATPASVAGQLAELAVVPELGLHGGPDGAAGTIATYRSPVKELARWFSIGTVAVEPADLPAVRWQLGAEDPVTVRGQQGWVGTRFPGRWSAVWWVSPGVLGFVDAGNLSRDEVLRVAGDARAVGVAEWQRRREVAMAPVPVDYRALLEGDLFDATWLVYLDGEGVLCSALRRGDDHVSYCAEPGSERVQVLDDDEIESDGDEEVPAVAVYGIMPEGAVGVATSIGDPLLQTATAVDGTQIYAFQLAGAAVPNALTFHDDAGNAVETVTIPVETATVGGR